MGEEPQAASLLAEVVDLSAYRSGRHSSRLMPVTLSSCTILSAGTAFALRHLWTACGQTAIARANPRTPNSSIARSIADFCSMLQVSTDGIPLSTDSGRGLLTRRGGEYRLQMVDISSCADFADFLAKFMKAEGLTRKDLEKVLNVGKAMVSKYLTKGSEPGEDKLALICADYPRYDIQELRKLVKGIKEPEQQHTVRTEFGARIGRMAESIGDDTLRFALERLVSSLERDSRKGTGTK